MFAISDLGNIEKIQTKKYLLWSNFILSQEGASVGKHFLPQSWEQMGKRPSSICSTFAPVVKTKLMCFPFETATRVITFTLQR